MPCIPAQHSTAWAQGGAEAPPRALELHPGVAPRCAGQPMLRTSSLRGHRAGRCHARHLCHCADLRLGSPGSRRGWAALAPYRPPRLPMLEAFFKTPTSSRAGKIIWLVKPLPLPRGAISSAPQTVSLDCWHRRDSGGRVTSPLLTAKRRRTVVEAARLASMPMPDPPIGCAACPLTPAHLPAQRAPPACGSSPRCPPRPPLHQAGRGGGT